MTTAWKSERKSRAKTTKNPSFRLWSLRHPAKESNIALGAQGPFWGYQELNLTSYEENFMVQDSSLVFVKQSDRQVCKNKFRIVLGFPNEV